MQSDLKPFRWMFIGSGRIANTVAKEITKTGRHYIVAVYSRNIKTSQDFSKRYGASVLKELSDINNQGFDGIYIATPQNSHYEYIKKCSVFRRPILVEKPFVVNYAELMAVYSMKENPEIHVYEAMCMLYNPLLKCIYDDCKMLGDIRTINISYALAMKYLLRIPRLLDNAYAGGALMEIGVYPISLCNYIMGHEPDEIHISAKIENNVDVSDTILLRYGETTCNIFISLKKFKGVPKASITGEKGSISIPWFSNPDSYYITLGNKKKISKAENGKYIFEFDAFANIVACSKQKEIGFADITEMTMRTLDKCREIIGLSFPNDVIDYEKQND